MVAAFLNFFVAMAKRELFIWKRKHEAMPLREVLVSEPHKYQPGSKERGISWTKIAEHLQQSGMKVTQRSAREKFDMLYQHFKKREKEESRASGVDVDRDEIHQAPTNIHDQIVDRQDQQPGQRGSEKATAEEMRKRATEKLSEQNEEPAWMMKKTLMVHVQYRKREKATPVSQNSWNEALREKPLNKLNNRSTKKRAWIACRGIASTTAIPNYAASATATIPAATTALLAATTRNEHGYVKYTLLSHWFTLKWYSKPSFMLLNPHCFFCLRWDHL